MLRAHGNSRFRRGSTALDGCSLSALTALTALSVLSAYGVQSTYRAPCCMYEAMSATQTPHRSVIGSVPPSGIGLPVHHQLVIARWCGVVWVGVRGAWRRWRATSRYPPDSSVLSAADMRCAGVLPGFQDGACLVRSVQTSVHQCLVASRSCAAARQSSICNCNLQSALFRHPAAIKPIDDHASVGHGRHSSVPLPALQHPLYAVIYRVFLSLSTALLPSPAGAPVY